MSDHNHGDDWCADEMRCLMECLGESPERMKGAAVVLGHLGHFFDSAHKFAHDVHPDEVGDVTSALVRGWLVSAVETLEPFGVFASDDEGVSHE
jgi:hypothetical protein